MQGLVIQAREFLIWLYYNSILDIELELDRPWISEWKSSWNEIVLRI